MHGDGWRLKPLASFIYLLVNEHDARDILQRRFKKAPYAYSNLFDCLELLDALGYEAGVEYAFNHRLLDTIRAYGALGLVELRLKKTLWRVVMYWNREMRVFVILDAFEAHRHTSMFEVVKMARPKLLLAERLLEGLDSDGDDNNA